MKQFLVVGLLFLILPHMNKAQAVDQDSLGLSVFADRRAKVAESLDPGECAVLFSGTYQSSAPNLAVPLPFTPQADFFYLTGVKIPNSVLVIFPKKIETREGLASDILFLPGPGENPVAAMGYGHANEFGKAGDSLLVRPTTQWNRFVIEILDSDQVEHIQTIPLDPRDYYFSVQEFSLHPAEILFGSMAPQFQVTPEASRFYQEIEQVKFDKANELIKKVLSWLKYHQEVPDKILKSFSEVRSEGDLLKVQGRIASIKFNFFKLRKTMDALRLKKSRRENQAMVKAGEVAVLAVKKAASIMQAGAFEREIQGTAELEVFRQGAGLGKATQVLAGLPGQALLYAQNNQIVPDKGTVVLDIGVRYNGYCAQLARTFPIGNAFSPGVAKVYQEIAAVHLATLKGCGAGTNPNEFMFTQQGKLLAKLDAILLVNGERRSGYRDNYVGGEIVSIGLEINEASCEGAMGRGMTFAVTTTVAVPRSRKFKSEYQGILIRLTDVVEVGDGASWLTKGMPLNQEDLVRLKDKASE